MMTLERSSRVLDDQASKHFSFRQLVECGETFKVRRPLLTPVPQHPKSWDMLCGLAQHILDPIVDEFGPLVLTYCFAPQWLTKWIKGRIAPALDQHAACELKGSGKAICERGGAAADFYVPGRSTAELVLWAVERTPRLPIDRLYYYKPDRPVHMSWSPMPQFSLWEMREYRPGAAPMPRKLDKSILHAARKAQS